MPHPNVKEFLRVMRGIDRSKTQTEVFRDFCEFSFCALAKTTAPTLERAEALEAQYMQAVARYRDKDDVRKMPELFALAAAALQAGGCDFLGEVAGEIGALDAGLGQFFTPYEVSRLNAEIIMADAPALIASRKFLTVQEPAAGAGGMVIAAADCLERHGLDLATCLWFEAAELNLSTYRMCYVQLSLRGLAGIVRHQNTLTLESYGHALTPAAFAFLAKNGHPFQDQRRQPQQIAHEPQPAPAPPLSVPNAAPLQLTLF